MFLNGSRAWFRSSYSKNISSMATFRASRNSRMSSILPKLAN